MPTGIATVTRRAARPDDDEFSRELFAASRPDLAMLSPAVREPLLDMQFRAQRSQYAESYPSAQSELLLVDGVAVGELIVDRAADAVCVVDITVTEARRGAGIGSAVLREEIAAADRAGVPVRLSVWSDNVGARRLYQRLGFAVTAESNGYLEMQRETATERSPA